MKFPALFTAALLAVTTLAFGAVPTANLYVDPARGDDANLGTTTEQAFRTITRARDHIRALRQPLPGNVIVHLRGGLYPIYAPIEFDDRDSAPHGLTVRYDAYKDETPVLDGGRRITGWSLHDSAKNIYRAAAPGLESRQLFVNGIRAVRARGTAGLTDPVVTPGGYTSSDTFLASWKNLSDLEMVYEAIWTKPRCGVASITATDTTATITMKTPGWKWVRDKGITSVKHPQYYENAYELLDQPGEWYLDRSGAVSGTAGTLFYIPRKDEDLATAEVVAPVTEKLIVVQGRSIDTPVRNLVFRRLSFAHTTWLRPNGPDGHPDAQNNVIRQAPVKEPGKKPVYTEFIIDGAAFTLKYANRILIERCRFERLGGTGLNAYAGTSDIIIRGSLFRDISGTGIQLGDYLGFLDPKSENYAFIADPDRKDLDRRLLLKNNLVSNNYLNDCGVEYRSSTAIAAAFPVDSKFVHNEIENMPYSGIHIGWAWVTMPRTSIGGNLIAGNRVNNIMKDLNDGGCIYVLGPQNSAATVSTIRENYVSRCSNQGIYLDDGASFYHVADNVASAIGDKCVKMVGTNKHDVTVVRTYTTKPLGDYTAPRTSVEPAIIAVKNEWSPAARAIMDRAGLEPAYRDLNPDAKPPKP